MNRYEPKNTFRSYGPTMPDPREHKRLARKWAMGKATRAEILRCMAMDRQTDNRKKG